MESFSLTLYIYCLTLDVLYLTDMCHSSTMVMWNGILLGECLVAMHVWTCFDCLLWLFVFYIASLFGKKWGLVF